MTRPRAHADFATHCIATRRRRCCLNLSARCESARTPPILQRELIANDSGATTVGKRRSARSSVANRTNAFHMHTSCHAAQKNARCARTLYYVLSSILCANYCALTSCRVDTNNPCAFQSRPPVRDNFVDSTDPSLSFATPRGGLGAAAFRD